MTKAETYEQAWRLGFKGDFSQVDSLYHPEYSAIDHTTSIKSNLNDDKVVVSTLSDSIVLGAYEVVSESKENLTIRVYSRFKNYEIYRCTTTQATYRDGKIITQKTDGRELDYDPSEGQDWNWEDFDRLGLGTTQSFQECFLSSAK